MKAVTPEKEPLKILIVDDEKNACFALSKILSAKGYRVDARESGLKALETLSRSRYDVLLTDISMPEMNGIELLKRANKIAPSMLKVVMTGHGDVTTYLEATNAGASEYLNKPVNTHDLDMVIKRHFLSHKSGDNT